MTKTTSRCDRIIALIDERLADYEATMRAITTSRVGTFLVTVPSREQNAFRT
jgi:hypothetical protein